MNHSEEDRLDPLPAEALEHLREHGKNLLGQLESMRQNEGERVEIEPLEPQAALALRQSGDRLLSKLEAMRHEPAPEIIEVAEPDVRRRRFPWIAIAACVAGVVACSWLFNDPSVPGGSNHLAEQLDDPAPVPNVVGTEAGEQPAPSIAVPEPSSGLLTLAGALLLLRRRRQD